MTQNKSPQVTKELSRLPALITIEIISDLEPIQSLALGYQLNDISKGAKVVYSGPEFRAERKPA